MRRTALNILFCCTSFFLLLIASMGCFKKPPSDFFPALTAAAATLQSGSSGSPLVSTQTPIQTSSPISPTEPENCLGESRSNSVNIRSGPSGTIIGCCLALGENVEIHLFDSSGEWALIKGVEKPTHQGWVKASYLNILGDCQMVPAGD